MAVDLEKRNDELARENEQLRKELEELQSKLATTEQERQLLERMLRNLNVRSYGKNSEKLAKGQLTFSFMNELVDEAVAEVDEEKLEEEFAGDESSQPDRKPKRRKSRRIPESAQRERVVLDVDPELRVCTCCDSEMQKIGEDTTTELDYVPAVIIAREYVRPKYACRKCQDGVLQEELPKRPIKKGFPGVGLLVHVLVSKYVDHQPLYRIEKSLRRRGVEIPRSTLCDWVAAMAELLRPVWEELKRIVLLSLLIQAYETPVKVLNKQGVKKGYLWTYGIPWREVVFDFTEGRGGVFAEEFLSDFSGSVQCDGYGGYDRLVEREIVRVGCWAHARRRFYDARGESKTAKLALAAIQNLYRIERQAKDEGISGEALVEHRREYAKPILDKLKSFLEERRHTVLPKSLTGEAIQYALNQWVALERYVDIAEAEIDNNSAENSIRPIAIGRKSWLFIGHRNAGPRAAIILSLVATCWRLKINPEEYLRDVIMALAEGTSRAAELTPARWLAAREEAKVTTENASA